MPEADLSKYQSHQSAPPRLPDSKDHFEGKPSIKPASAFHAVHHD